MHEHFPLLAGVSIALLAQHVPSPRLRNVGLVGMALLLGLIASVISGEIFVSGLFALVDTALVLLAAVVTTVVIRVWKSNSRRLY